MPESQESSPTQNEPESSESRSGPSITDRESNHPVTQERSELVHLGQEIPLLRGEKAIITSLPVPQPYDFKGLARGMAERPETKVLSVLELDPQEIAPALGMMVINETGQVVPVSFLPKGRAALHYQRNNLDRPGELEWHQFDLFPEYMGDPRVEEFNKSPNIESAWLEVKGQSGDSYKISFTHVFRGREKAVTGVRYKMEKIEKKAEEEKKEEPEKTIERGEVRIKSGIKGLTWSLASSSGDTADYDTDPANLVYGYASETTGGTAREQDDTPVAPADNRKTAERQGGGYQRDAKERYLLTEPVPLTEGRIILIGSEPEAAVVAGGQGSNNITIEGLPRFQMAFVMSADGTSINEVAARDSRAYRIQLRRLRDGRVIKESFDPKDARYSKNNPNFPGSAVMSEHTYASEVDPSSIAYGILDQNGKNLEFEIRIVGLEPGAKSFNGGMLEIIDRRRNQAT